MPIALHQIVSFMPTVSSSKPDLPIGYIDIRIGPQDPMGPPTNCGTHNHRL